MHRATAAIFLIAIAATGCERQPAPKPAPTTAPATRPATTTTMRATDDKPAVAPPEKPKPAKPTHDAGTAWAKPIDVTDPEANSKIDATAPGGNRLHIRTENVRVLRLDLKQLPAGIPDRGPWNLTIDHQAIEITGRRGRIVTLVRTPGGNWDVTETRD